MSNLCDVCGQKPFDVLLVGQPAGRNQLCNGCYSLGLFAAAKQAYQVEKHRQAVSRGYGGNVTAGASAIVGEDTK